jgi:hypothetical protein
MPYRSAQRFYDCSRSPDNDKQIECCASATPDDVGIFKDADLGDIGMEAEGVSYRDDDILVPRLRVFSEDSNVQSGGDAIRS